MRTIDTLLADLKVHPQEYYSLAAALTRLIAVDLC
jgi:hypothetical protein